jgi:hypothetical protein
MSKFTYMDIPALYKKYGSLSGICRGENVTYSYMHRRYVEAVRKKQMSAVDMGAKSHAHRKNPTVRQREKALKTKKDRHHTYILTCAQNNTDVHEKTWLNILALAHFYDAKLMVSQFMYGKRGLGARNDKAQLKRTSAVRDLVEEVWFDPRIEPFINNERVEIAKGLVWCGELNILPTAVSPLTGLESYTGRKSMVAPHVTQQMASVATYGEGDGAKLNFCTGTITQRNYIQRKEGFKAEFHHMYGALWVEVDEDGHWWCRQLNADSEGRIYHIDGDDVVLVEDGVITGGHRVLSVTSGDTHEDQKDPVVHEAKYRKGGMIDVLKPQYNFIHDLLNFERRSHHNIKDPYFLLEQHVLERESVEDELLGCRGFLMEIKRPGTLTVVVDSNHDRHLDKWLTTTDGRYDPVNARIWSDLNKLKVDLIYKGIGNQLFRHAIIGAAGFLPPKLWGEWEGKNNVRFLLEDEGFVTARQYGGGIENGMHGDRAGNGARGNIRSFAKMGRRSNVAHSHTCGIFQGCFQAGTNSKKPLRYAHGASSWTQSDIVTFENSKRCIVTFAFGKWHS